MSESGSKAPVIFLGQPGYGQLTAGAARAFWRATRRPSTEVYYQYQEGSLLATNFNMLWCSALNLAARGLSPTYFAMIHADVEPCEYWLDKMIGELDANDLDILGAAVPIKDPKGLTSLALGRPDGDTWRPLCRLTLSEIHALPETFTSDDLGHPLLLNTGLWVCRFDESWARKVHFTINDRIVCDRDGNYHAQVEPEDWYFSRLLHELGLKVGATRKIPLVHRGGTIYSNAHAWGEPVDREYVAESQVGAIREAIDPGYEHPAIDGWLTPQEGQELARLAKGKRVLEIGSYCGLSTVCMAREAAIVVSVDPHDGRGTPMPRDTYGTFVENLRRHGVVDRVAAIRGTVEDGRESLERLGPFDLAFIDGSHDYESVSRDIRDALEYLHPNGLLAFHDYRRPADPGVAAAVDEFLASTDAELVSLTGSVAVVKSPARSLVTSEA